MNIIETEQVPFSARTSRYKESDRKVTYRFIDEYHSIGIDKRDILSAQLEACKELLIDTVDSTEIEIVQTEISELKIMLGENS